MGRKVKGKGELKVNPVLQRNKPLLKVENDFNIAKRRFNKSKNDFSRDKISGAEFADVIGDTHEEIAKLKGELRNIRIHQSLKPKDDILRQDLELEIRTLRKKLDIFIGMAISKRKQEESK